MPKPPLDRLLGDPRLARVVPRLPAEVLHRVIATCGLEGSTGLLERVTPEQLTGILDLDLWRPATPGLDERFDAARFGEWIDVLAEAGVDAAARTLAAMDAGLAAAGLAHHVRVFDAAAVSRYPTLDGDLALPFVGADDPGGCDVGGYRLFPRRMDAWEAIVDLLSALASDHADCFHELMRRARALSNAGAEADELRGLLEPVEQAVFDLAIARERRREARGYATPARARAFIQMARELDVGPGSVPPDPRLLQGSMRPLDVANDVVNAAGAADGAPPPAVPHPDEAARAAGEVAALLGAGFVERPPRALPGGGSQEAPPRLHRLRARLQVLLDRDPVRYAARTQELAVLANTIASGCSIQARAFTPQEASDAAAAVCNLGLENWPRHWGEESQDLLGVFQVGWAVLHARVGMYAAERLVAVLASLRCGDGETQRDLAALRIQLARDCRAGTPWRSRDALETLAVLDLPAWAALVGLIDECPVVHAVIDTPPDRPVLAIAADAFAFVSENRQIAQVHAFLRSLPDRLAR